MSAAFAADIDLKTLSEYELFFQFSSKALDFTRKGSKI
jgi:hypothetical protein